MHFMAACRMYEKDQLGSESRTENLNMYPLNGLLFQGYNTVVFMLRTQQYVLAVHSLRQLKKAMQSVPLLYGESNAFPSACIEQTCQMLKND